MGMIKGQKQYGQKFTNEVMRMHYEEGMTTRKIAEYFNLPNKKVVVNAISREHARQRKLEAGILPLAQGKSRKRILTPEQEKDKRIKELEMQVELLKKFHEELRR